MRTLGSSVSSRRRWHRRRPRPRPPPQPPFANGRSRLPLSHISVAESAARFLPFALRTPLVPVLHSVHLPAFFRFAANATRRAARQFGGGRRKRQLQMLDRRGLKSEA